MAVLKISLGLREVVTLALGLGGKDGNSGNGGGCFLPLSLLPAVPLLSRAISAGCVHVVWPDSSL